MNIDNIRFQGLSQSAFDWVQRKYLAVDGRSPEEYAGFLAEDCVLQFGNNPLVHGSECAIAGIEGFWKNIAGLDHHFLNIYGSDDHPVIESLIDYTRLDSRVVSIPCVTIIDRNASGLAQSVRIFIDVAPVFAATHQSIH